MVSEEKGTRPVERKKKASQPPHDIRRSSRSPAAGLPIISERPLPETPKRSSKGVGLLFFTLDTRDNEKKVNSNRVGRVLAAEGTECGKNRFPFVFTRWKTANRIKQRKREIYVYSL